MSINLFEFRSKGKLDTIHVTNPRDPAKRKRLEAAIQFNTSGSFNASISSRYSSI